MKYNQLTTEQFIEKAKKVHGDKYDYSKVVYVNSQTKVCIICPIHGEFSQTPNAHLRGQGCPTCNGHPKLTIDIVKQRCFEKYGNKFTILSDKINKYNDKLRVFCNEIDEEGNYHGEFTTRVNKFLDTNPRMRNGKLYYRKGGCPKCRKKSLLDLKKDYVWFEEKASEKHNGKYTYNHDYDGAYSRVTITCPIHGDFIQTAFRHLRGDGCPMCGKIKMLKAATKYQKSNEEFIRECKQFLPESITYEKTNYVNAKTKVTLTCKYHGDFTVNPHSMLNGKTGCPSCGESHLEREMRHFLNDNGVKFEAQKRFEWLKNIDTGYTLPLDFYLPEYNVAIECQGEQHFMDGKRNIWFGQTIESENFVKEQRINTINRDKLKKKICEEHGIKIYYISNLKSEYWDKLYYSKKELLNEIKEHSYFETMKEVLCESK